MVTGWNEWTAGRWGEAGGPIVFVDQFDQEFSRDIALMKGGHGDNYYWLRWKNLARTEPGWLEMEKNRGPGLPRHRKQPAIGDPVRRPRPA
jgi:hypothetical protein